MAEDVPPPPQRRLVRTQFELGGAVSQFREHQGMTQQELADTLGTNRSLISHLEQGLRIPDGDMLEAICLRLAMPEGFWRGHCVRKLRPDAVAIRGHFFTYYTKKSLANSSEKIRNRLVGAIKNNQRRWRHSNGSLMDPRAYVAGVMRRKFPNLFSNRTLVPVPTCRASDTLRDEDWAGLQFARALAARGANMEVSPLVSRLHDVDSASRSGRRLSVDEHLDSLDLLNESWLPSGLLLVDDVVTRGTQMVACAKLFRDIGWPGEIDGIAVGYTRKHDEVDATEGKTFEYRWDGFGDHPSRRA